MWETRGPDAGDSFDENYLQNIGKVLPVRTETIARRRAPRLPRAGAAVLDPDAVDAAARHPRHHDRVRGGEFASPETDTILPLPYTDDYSYDEYAVQSVNGVAMDYVQRRGGSPRYTADQNGAFEVVDSGTDRGNVMEQRIHAGNRGYTWNVWGDGSQRNPSTATPATVLGDHAWTNYTASVDFRLDGVVRDASLENFAGLGVRQVVAEGADLATYAARVHDDGSWELRKLGSTVAVGERLHVRRVRVAHAFGRGEREHHHGAAG